MIMSDFCGCARSRGHGSQRLTVIALLVSTVAACVLMVETPTTVAKGITARVKAPSSVVRGNSVRISGHIAGFRGTVTVVLQRRISGRWLGRGSSRVLRRPGSFELSWQVETPAPRLTLRIGVRRAGRLLLASAAFQVRVRTPPRQPSKPVVDTTPPDTSITDGPAGTLSATAVTIHYASSETGSNFECQLDGGPWAQCAQAAVSYAGLAPGGHSFAVRAVDAAGNRDLSPATAAWSQLLADPSRCNITQSRSLGGGAATVIRFMNESGRTVSLSWLNYEGSPVFYSFIPTDSYVDQPTYAMQPWVLVDSDGRCVGYTIAQPVGTTYVIAPGA